MDLLASVRKEGSRGGTGGFKWSDVQNSTRRENYLGHSLMAPVGRWQKGRDLNWYAKGDTPAEDGEDPAQREARERKEELQRVKEAEQDAMARAMGLPVAPRSNANLEPVINKRAMSDVVKSATPTEEQESGRGIGYDGGRSGHRAEAVTERIEGNAESQDKELQNALKEYKRRHRGSDDEQRSGRRTKERRSHHREDHHRSRRHRSHSREGHRRRPLRSRSRSPRRDRRRDDHGRTRSRSPHRSRREHRNDHERRRHDDDADGRR